jgi:hypothetical protein
VVAVVWEEVKCGAKTECSAKANKDEKVLKLYRAPPI